MAATSTVPANMSIPTNGVNMPVTGGFSSTADTVAPAEADDLSETELSDGHNNHRGVIESADWVVTEYEPRSSTRGRRTVEDVTMPSLNNGTVSSDWSIGKYFGTNNLVVNGTMIRLPEVTTSETTTYRPSTRESRGAATKSNRPKDASIGDVSGSIARLIIDHGEIVATIESKNTSINPFPVIESSTNEHSSTYIGRGSSSTKKTTAADETAEFKDEMFVTTSRSDTEQTEHTVMSSDDVTEEPLYSDEPFYTEAMTDHAIFNDSSPGIEMNGGWRKQLPRTTIKVQDVKQVEGQDFVFTSQIDVGSVRSLPAHEALRSAPENNASSLSSSSSSAAVGPSRPSASVSGAGLLREEVATVGVAIAGVAVFWSLLALATCVAVRAARNRKRRRRRMRDTGSTTNIDDSTAVQAAMMDAMIRAELARGRLQQPNGTPNGSGVVRAPTYVNVAEMAAATPNGEFVRFIGDKIHANSLFTTGDAAIVPWWTCQPRDGYQRCIVSGRGDSKRASHLLGPAAIQKEQLSCPKPPPPPLLVDWRATGRQNRQLPAPMPLRSRQLYDALAVGGRAPLPPPPPFMPLIINAGGGRLTIDASRSTTNGCRSAITTVEPGLQTRLTGDAVFRPISSKRFDPTPFVVNGLATSGKGKSLDSLIAISSLSSRDEGQATLDNRRCADNRKNRRAAGAGGRIKRSVSASRCSAATGKHRAVSGGNMRYYDTPEVTNPHHPVGSLKLADSSALTVIPDISRDQQPSVSTVHARHYSSPARATYADKNPTPVAHPHKTIFVGGQISDIFTAHGGVKSSSSSSISAIYDTPTTRTSPPVADSLPRSTIDGSTGAHCDSFTIAATATDINELDIRGRTESKPSETLTSQYRFALPLDVSTRTPLLIQRMVNSSSSCVVSGVDIEPQSSFAPHSTGVATTSSTKVIGSSASRLSSAAPRPTTAAPAFPLDSDRRFPPALFDAPTVRSTSTATISGSGQLWRFPTSVRPSTGSTVVAAPISVGGSRPARFPRMGQSCLTVGTDCGGHRGSQRSCGLVALTSDRRTDTRPEARSNPGGRHLKDAQSSHHDHQVAARSPPYAGGQLTALSRSQFFV